MNAKARVFRGKIAFLAGIILLAAQAAVYAQEPSLEEPALEELPGLRERAVVMHIVSRIVEQNQMVVWNSENSRVTIPGRPVGLKLVSSNVVVAVQFTPFLRPKGRHMLVAQGQIWVSVPNEGVQYHTTMQTIPLEFGKQIYFFPLGSMEAQDEARIEIELMLEPYTGTGGDPSVNANRRHMGRHRGMAGDTAGNGAVDGSGEPPTPP